MTKTMKKMPAFLLAGVIAVAFAFAIGTVTAQKAYADSYDLYVGGVQVTDDNKADPFGPTCNLRRCPSPHVVAHKISYLGNLGVFHHLFFF